jgi:hypothetical protein
MFIIVLYEIIKIWHLRTKVHKTVAQQMCHNCYSVHTFPNLLFPCLLLSLYSHIWHFLECPMQVGNSCKQNSWFSFNHVCINKIDHVRVSTHTHTHCLSLSLCICTCILSQWISQKAGLWYSPGLRDVLWDSTPCSLVWVHWWGFSLLGSDAVSLREWPPCQYQTREFLNPTKHHCDNLRRLKLQMKWCALTFKNTT